MSNLSPKRIIKNTRDKFLASIIESTARIEASQKNQAELSRKLLDLYQRLENTVNNSGHIRLSPDVIMTKIFSGAKMYLDPNDIAVVPHLILDREWEHEITQAWLSVIKKDDIVVDIGANFGYFGLLAAQQSNRNCKIILFEANPNLIPYLQKTINVNSLDKISVIENQAIAESNGKVKLNILKDYIGSSSIQSIEVLNKQNKVKMKVESTISVPATTLDDYCKDKNIKQINLIKMDIEGYEEKAYQGMRNIVKASQDLTMFVEFTRAAYDNPKQFYEDMLDDFGHVYLIDKTGKLVEPANKGYEHVIGKSELDEWVMPVFSKIKNIKA